MRRASKLSSKLLQPHQLVESLFDGKTEIFADECAIHILFVRLDQRINSMLVWSAHDVMPSNVSDYITTIMMGKLCYLGARNRLAGISDGAQLRLNLINSAQVRAADADS